MELVVRGAGVASRLLSLDLDRGVGGGALSIGAE
jgi:hypothetical protein